MKVDGGKIHEVRLHCACTQEVKVNLSIYTSPALHIPAQSCMLISICVAHALDEFLSTAFHHLEPSKKI